MQNLANISDEYVPFFEQLPDGYVQLGGVDKMICDEECGEIYYQRGFITPDGWAIIERTPCRCLIPRLQQKENNQQQQQHQYLKAQLERSIFKYFSNIDLMTDPDYNHMAFHNYKPNHDSQRKALERLQGFKPGRDSVLLHGEGGGRGKTHLALSVAREGRKQGMSALALKTQDLLDRLKASYDKKRYEDENDINSILRRVDILVLDDIGVERATEWAIAKFYKAIDYRYDHHRTTI